MSQLEAPITLDCIAEALAHLPPSKAPGSDVLPLEFYTQFQEVLIPKLQALYAHIFESATLPASMGEALIVLIPKPGKDPLFPESYRPISLLQLDVKILAKILALRLNKVILCLIHPDQTVFMPNKNTAFSLRRLFMNLQAEQDNIGSRVVVSLDAIHWNGTTFGNASTDLASTLNLSNGYSFSTRPSLPGSKSTAGSPDPFALSRGTRQGCPISPLLYALAVEPLAIAIRDHPHIKGLCMGQMTETLSLYADDMLLYLEDSGPSLVAALQSAVLFCPAN